MYRRNNLAYRIIDSFFRHRWIFLISLLATTGLVYGVMALRAQGYSATARIFVNAEKDLNKALGNASSPWANPAADNAQHFYNLMRDDLPGGFIEQFLSKAQLRQPIRVDPEAKDKRLVELEKSLSAGVEGKELLFLRLQWPDKRECESILRGVQDTFIEEAGQSRQVSSMQTANFLDGQIKAYKQRMDKAENALAEYRSKHFGQLPAAQQSLIERLSQLNQELDYLNITTRDADQKIAFYEKRLAAVEPTSIASKVLGKSKNATVIDQLVMQREAAIASGYRPDSLTVRDINAQIRVSMGALQNEQRKMKTGDSVMTDLQSTNETPNPEYENSSQALNDAKIVAGTQKERMKLLIAQIAKYENAVKDLPQAEKALNAKTSDYEILRKQMQEMLERRESMRLKANVDKLNGSAGLAKVGRINAESTTSTMKNLLMLAGSALLGLIAGVLVVIGREWLDPTIRYEPDIERTLGVPVLAGLLDSREVLALPEGDTRRSSRPALPMPPAAAGR